MVRHIPNAYKVAPEERLVQTETCRAFNEKSSLITRIFVHLVGLYTYYKMMDGTYNGKLILVSLSLKIK